MYKYAAPICQGSVTRFRGKARGPREEPGRVTIDREPSYMFSLRTLNDVFFLTTESPRERAMLWQDRAGDWHPISTGQLTARVSALALALLKLEAQKGDRIALIAENRWEWAVTDFAALAIGAVDVPLFPTLTGEQMAPLLENAGARIAVVSSRKQFEKLVSIQDRTKIKAVLLMDDEEIEGAIRFSTLLPSAETTAERLDPEIERRSRAILPDDLATLIYTSGTTAEPKGVMLTHGNIASNANRSTELFGWNSSASLVSFLPLSHITARHLDYAMFCYGAAIAYCPRVERLAGAMKAVQPTIFVAVPRVFEKIRQEVERRSGISPLKKRIFTWALKVGAHHRETVLKGQRPSSLSWRLAERLVYNKVRDSFGGKAKDFLAGGAPLGLDTARWFADVGIRIFEGYGLTETSPVISLNNGTAYRIGSTGKQLPNVECRFAEDGELLVRGPSIFKSYWQNEAFTAEALTPDGWFHTGDIGRIDEDGFLFITDRKKELIKTSNGKFIAPQTIEGKFKANALVGNVALVGDRRKFISALISPNFEVLESWAKEQGIAVDGRETLLADKRVQARYRAIVSDVNKTLANFEVVKRFRLVPDEWTSDSGELTPSMKLKRRVVEGKYRELIAGFYSDSASDAPAEV